MRQPPFAACMCSDSYLHLELANLPLFGKAQTGISGSNAPRTTGFAGKPRIGNRPTTHCVAGDRLEIDINHGRLQSILVYFVLRTTADIFVSHSSAACDWLHPQLERLMVG